MIVRKIVKPGKIASRVQLGSVAASQQVDILRRERLVESELSFEDFNFLRTNAFAVECRKWSARHKVDEREEDEAEQKQQTDGLNEPEKDVIEH
jgi:hypothetical protein